MIPGDVFTFALVKLPSAFPNWLETHTRDNILGRRKGGFEIGGGNTKGLLKILIPSNQWDSTIRNQDIEEQRIVTSSHLRKSSPVIPSSD